MRTIAHISDLHFGRLDVPVAEALVADLHAQNPSLLVISGDFTQRARAWQFSQAAEFLGRLPRPRLIVPGNHDVPIHPIRRFFYPLRGYLKHISDDLSPVYQDDELLAVGASTARAWTHKSGWITEKQMRAIEARMNLARANLVKVVVTHHPFIPPPADPAGDTLRGAPWVLRRLEACGVDLLLAGHLHLAYHDDIRAHHVSARRSILSVQAGTATSTRRRGEPNAYNLITVNPDHVAIAVRSWDGSAFTEIRVARYRRLDPIWQREPARTS